MEGGRMETIWLSPTGFVTGDPTLQISYPFVSHPGTVVTCTAPGDLKGVSMGLRLPPNAKIEDVIIGYEVSSPRSFISQIRLAETKTPDHATVLRDDPTPLQSTSPASHTSHVGGLVAEGAVILELRSNFQNTSDEIRLGAVGVTFQRPAEHCVNVRDFGAKGDGVTDDTAALQAAVAAIPSSGGTICFPVGTYKVTKNITLPANISAIFDREAMLAPASGVTVTMNCEIRAGLYQIFTTGAGLIRGFSNAPFLLPQWWGAKADGVRDDGPAIQASLDAVPDLGGTITFSSGHYVSSQGFIVKAHGTTVTGLRSAYSYGGFYGTQVEFKSGTTGFDFCLGLAATDPNWRPTEDQL
jgi:hypothetical protein